VRASALFLSFVQLKSAGGNTYLASRHVVLLLFQCILYACDRNVTRIIISFCGVKECFSLSTVPLL
jgi:hypothetical protein